MGVEVEEPVTPHSQLLQSPNFNLVILPAMGFATPIDVGYFRKCLAETLVQHPRFHSILVNDENHGKIYWKPTTVDLDNHVFVPDVDPDMESPDEFVEDFTSKISMIPLDVTKPLWEVHILNMKTRDANSTAIFKVHHSMGDGSSFSALLLACSKKISDPESLPVLPSKKQQELLNISDKGWMKRRMAVVWKVAMIMYYTMIDTVLFFLTIMFLSDKETPIKGERGMAESKKRYMHRIISLDDVKLVKNAMKVSINDALLGVTQAGLSSYLYKKYENQRDGAQLTKQTNVLPKSLRIKSVVLFNVKPPVTVQELSDVIEKGKKLDKGRWGNALSLVTVPFRIKICEDPLRHIREAKTVMDRKKLTAGPRMQYNGLRKAIEIFGVKSVSYLTSRFVNHTTFSFSNVVGPQEEIMLFGHHLSYIAPTVSGFPQALFLHYQSYANKLIVCLAVDENLIPDPHQLFDDLQNALKSMKDAVIQSGLESRVWSGGMKVVIVGQGSLSHIAVNLPPPSRIGNKRFDGVFMNFPYYGPRSQECFVEYSTAQELWKGIATT